MVQCVYKISCVDENIKEFYIGSTDNLKCRTNHHKHLFNNNEDNRKLYNFIRLNGGLSNWDIYPIEIFTFLTEEELKQHEQFYLDEYKPELNSKRALGIDKERRKIAHNARDKKYYQKHKEKINEKRKEKINCKVCNKLISKPNISTHIKKQHPTPT